ncbi:MAG: hypothetical protein DRJ68_07055 [Thermoprotei archaeon]|nr:MAG: hypothetical protein DRJ62_05905 [Thermoprotei archaeon]RLF18111.1 MAG: hypothetical protein DRJ68_07055 [Thermoprotei archaeon]
MSTSNLKVSARNLIRGRVVGIEEGAITCIIEVEVRDEGLLTAVVPKELIEELKLEKGDVVTVAVRPTSIVVAKSKGTP